VRGYEELTTFGGAFGIFEVVYGVRPFNIFQMIEEASTGHAGATGRQVTLNTSTANAAGTLALMSELEAADARGVVNLRAHGRRGNQNAVVFSFRATGLYESERLGVQLTPQELRDEAATGVTLVTLTAALRENFGTAPQPLLATFGSVGNGVIDDPPLPHVTSGAGNPSPISVGGIDVDPTGTIFIDGVETSGVIGCEDGVPAGPREPARGRDPSAPGAEPGRAAQQRAADVLGRLERLRPGVSPRRRRRALAVAAGGALLAGLFTASPGQAAVEIVICGSHHRVLPYWLAAWRAGALGEGEEAGGTVVHFDAHPDLAPPKGVPDLAAPLAEVDIASFQLAAAWWGLARRFVWVRPVWADQLPDGGRSFLVGEAPGGGLRASDEADYYVLDEGWARREALGRPVRVELVVVPLDAAARGLEVAGPWGLGLPEAPEARIAALGDVMAAAQSTTGGPFEALGGLARLWRYGIGAGDLARLGWALRAEIALDGETLADQGRYVVGLPEHRAASAEMRATARAVAGLVEAVGHPPVLVTIARSVEDRYTPRDAWPLAEWSVLSALAEVLPDADVRFDAGLAPAPRIDPGLLDR
jgi:hypothetical protein